MLIRGELSTVRLSKAHAAGFEGDDGPRPLPLFQRLRRRLGVAFGNIHADGTRKEAGKDSHEVTKAPREARWLLLRLCDVVADAAQ